MALSDEYSHKLQGFYDKHRISVRGFDCKYRSDCEQDAQPSILLHGAEGYVGPLYGEALKVVCMSLDIGNETEDGDRTMLGRRRIFETLVKESNPHLKRTRVLLQSLFSKGDAVLRDNPWSFIVLLNAAKCSRSERKEKVPDKLFERCRPFAQEEISLLDPDVLLTQGNKSEAVLGETEQISDVELDEIIQASATQSPFSRDELAGARGHICLARIGERRVVALHGPHPTDYGSGRWKEFEKKMSACTWLVRELAQRRH